ncbi:MAG: 2,3-bisphosphoglycerate-independent phosphoglycerate mutase, partial [Actinomycetota bacterium]
MDNLLSRLAIQAETKIVLVVMDGLGGFRSAERGSELEEATTTNLDRLAAEGGSGLLTIVAPGVTPGSGAGHLALFGYDPLVYELGRGALSAAGIEFDLKAGDVAARVNFCTLDPSGIIMDRRADRLSSEENRRLCSRIKEGLSLETGVELFLETERDHRALLVLRGEGLSPAISDTDPQILGLAPRDPRALSAEAEPTVRLLGGILGQIRSILAGKQANFILLRGFDTLRELPSFAARYGLQAVGITVYPMYRGLARILGMEVAPPQTSFEHQVETLEACWD